MIRESCGMWRIVLGPAISRGRVVDEGDAADGLPIPNESAFYCAELVERASLMLTHHV
jgi:hypothetical protein